MSKRINESGFLLCEGKDTTRLAGKGIKGNQ